MWCTHKYPPTVWKRDHKIYSGLTKEWASTIFKGRETHTHAEVFSFSYKEFEPVWNAGKENLFPPVSHDEGGERGGELSKLNACHTLFPLHDARSGDVTPMWRYHGRDKKSRIYTHTHTHINTYRISSAFDLLLFYESNHTNVMRFETKDPWSDSNGFEWKTFFQKLNCSWTQQFCSWNFTEREEKVIHWTQQPVKEHLCSTCPSRQETTKEREWPPSLQQLPCCVSALHYGFAVVWVLVLSPNPLQSGQKTQDLLIWAASYRL